MTRFLILNFYFQVGFVLTLHRSARFSFSILVLWLGFQRAATSGSYFSNSTLSTATRMEGHKKKGKYHEAYDVFRDVLSIKCTVYGTGHPEVASAYKSLGNVHYKLGELADAERQYRHALSIYRATRGEEHPDTAAARTTIDHIRYWMKEENGRMASSSFPKKRTRRTQLL